MSVDKRYLMEWSGMTRGVLSAVDRPTTTDGLVRDSDRKGREITIQGGLTGGAVPAHGDIVINM